MKNVVVCLLLVNMLLIYSTEFGVCDETTKTLPKLWTKSILFWEWVIYILQNFHQPPESLLCFRTIALENLLSLLCTNQRILCSAKRWIVIMVVHTTSSNDTVSLSLFKLVSFGICVFMNTSHTHSYTKDVFFSEHRFNGCHFIHQVCGCVYGEGKHAKKWIDDSRYI